LILLLVTIGLLNIGLGFSLAMFYGYGPPGLDGIFEALGSMPVATPIAGGLAAAYDPYTAMEPEVGTSALAEEQVLDDVRDLSRAAQASVLDGHVESRE
jgi:hypothetical protein